MQRLSVPTQSPQKDRELQAVRYNNTLLLCISCLALLFCSIDSVFGAVALSLIRQSLDC